MMRQQCAILENLCDWQKTLSNGTKWKADKVRPLSRGLGLGRPKGHARGDVTKALCLQQKREKCRVGAKRSGDRRIWWSGDRNAKTNRSRGHPWSNSHTAGGGGATRASL